MRRTLPRILAPRPRPHLRRTLTTASALHVDWRDRLHKKLWGANAAAAAAAATAATATTTTLPPPAPLEPAADQTDYMEAFDARPLRIVGLAAPSSSWNIAAFTTTPPLVDSAALAAAVRRATIEVLTLTLHARPSNIAYIGPSRLTARVRVSVAADGEATLLFLGDAEVALVDGVEREYEEEEEEEGQVQQQEEDGWRDVKVAGGMLFAVVRRVVQLTGRRIPDPVVSRTVVAGDLLEYLVEKPKPAKLWDVLQAETELEELPNVKVYATRVRPWDKERMVGRERPFEKAVAFRYPFEAAAKV